MAAHNRETLQADIQYALGLAEESSLDPTIRQTLDEIIRRHTNTLLDLIANDALHPHQLDEAHDVLTQLEHVLDGL